MIGLNIGSGQRRFDIAKGWVNIDRVSRGDQVPDMLCDVGAEPLPFADESVDVAVLHQVYEHFGCDDGLLLIQECHRALKPGGSLILTVPDMRRLVQRWLTREISDYIFFVNVYGAFQGQESDRHRWGYTRWTLQDELYQAAIWTNVMLFDDRFVDGADIAKDWWILGLEAVK